MSKKTSEQLVKEIIKDIHKTIDELRQKELIRDECGLSEKSTGPQSYEISFSGKSGVNSVMLDKHVSASYVMNTLLLDRQYTILLYDKGIIQAEFRVDDGEVIKERLIFLKKHNRVWNKEEIAMADAEDEDWFADEESVPIFLRVDYDPSCHVECDHPASHMTLSNAGSCRIPIQDALTFSEFMRFILLHFYGVKLEVPIYRLEKENTISYLERKTIHLGWNS